MRSTSTLILKHLSLNDALKRILVGKLECQQEFDALNTSTFGFICYLASLVLHFPLPFVGSLS